MLYPKSSILLLDSRDKSHEKYFLTFSAEGSYYLLKVQSCKLYNSKYVIALTQITKTEIFVFISVLVFNLLSYKVLFINRKDNRTVKK